MPVTPYESGQQDGCKIDPPSLSPSTDVVRGLLDNLLLHGRLWSSSNLDMFRRQSMLSLKRHFQHQYPVGAKNSLIQTALQRDVRGGLGSRLRALSDLTLLS